MPTPGQSPVAQVRERMVGAKVQGHIRKESVTTLGMEARAIPKGGTVPEERLRVRLNRQPWQNTTGTYKPLSSQQSAWYESMYVCSFCK